MLNSLRQSLANLLRRLAEAIDPTPVWQQPSVRPRSHGGPGEER
jgi:hypothetical protein